MDVSLMNPFIVASVEVIKTMAFVEVTVGKPYVKQDSVAAGDVSGLVGLTGESNGALSISFSDQCILKIVSNMLGEEFDTVNDDIRDAVGELLNMISGQGRRTLDDMGHNFQAAVPTVITGKDHVLSYNTKGPKIAIPFDTSHGPFTIEICFEQKK